MAGEIQETSQRAVLRMVEQADALQVCTIPDIGD